MYDIRTYSSLDIHSIASPRSYRSNPSLFDCNLESGSNRNTPNACIIVYNKCRFVRNRGTFFAGGLPSCLSFSVRVINLGLFRGIFLICTMKKKKGKRRSRPSPCKCHCICAQRTRNQLRHVAHFFRFRLSASIKHEPFTFEQFTIAEMRRGKKVAERAFARSQMTIHPIAGVSSVWHNVANK